MTTAEQLSAAGPFLLLILGVSVLMVGILYRMAWRTAGKEIEEDRQAAEAKDQD